MARLCFTLTLLVLSACDAPVFVPADAGGRLTGRVFPERPTNVDGAELPASVFVLRDPSVSDGATHGWDIDRRCSVEPEPPAVWDVECAPAGDNVADLDMCIDDSFGTNLAATFQPLGEQLEVDVALALEGGEHVHLVRVSEWSGEADDPGVRIEIARALYGFPNGGARGDPLVWDGLDTFVPVEEAFDRGQVRMRDEDAYVADGVLVAHLPDDSAILLHAGTRSMLLRLTDPTLTARISDDSLSDVIITGRWRVDRLIAELDMVGLCDGDPLRTAVEIRARDAVDIRTEPRGGPGMSAPCESISVTLGFDVYLGGWGDTPEPEDVRPAPCAP